ncbi:MAG: SLC13 family permease [Promethearchaeati archaeon SRVP18_Atabeyarchaeia-1]
MVEMEKKIRKFTRDTWIRIQPYIFIILMISVVAVILLFGAAAQTVSAIFIAITLITYALIATEKMHRTLASLGGAISTLIALKITGKMPDLMDVISGSSPLVDWSVILIIISVAIVSEIAKDSGLFDFITIKMIKRSGGEPLKLLLYFSLLMVLLSALLGDVPAFMIVCTLTMMVTKGLDLNPVPYVMTEIIVANATAMVTVVASFVNLLVAGYFGMNPAYFLSYVGFLAIGLPFALIAMVVTYLYVKRFYRKDLQREGISRTEIEKLKKSIMLLNEKEFIKDPKFFRNSAIILIGTLFLFAISSFIGIPFYVVGLIGAFAFIFMSGIDPLDAFHKVDWSLIFFIMGLFIVVGGLDRTGVLAAAGSAIGAAAAGSLPLLIIVITLFAGTISGFLDDISVATALIYTVKPMMVAAGLLTPTPILWAIMISANLGGNISPIGGVANIMGITALQKAGAKQGWKQFFKVGVPLTFIFLGLAMVYLIIVSALLGW